MERKRSRIANRAISLILSLVMILTTFCIFDVGSVFSHAAVSENGSAAGTGDVYLYAPEVIYLRPYSNSWKETTQSDFQFYIQNNVTDSSNNIVAPDAVTTSSDYSMTGSLYFKADSGVSDISVSTRWLKKDGTDMSDTTGASVSVSSAESVGNGYKFTVNSGTAPKLVGVWNADQSQDETGCYLEWTVKYTDTDGYEKAVTAYTYVYKPYTVPTGATVRCQRNDADFNSNLTWMSGFHGIATTSDKTTSMHGWGTYGSNGYAYYGGRDTLSNDGGPFSAAGFLSREQTRINNTTDSTGRQVSLSDYLNYDTTDQNSKIPTHWGTPMYMVFSSRYAYANNLFRWDIATKSPNYQNTSGADKSNTYDINTFRYVSVDVSKSGNGSYTHKGLGAANDLAAVSEIYIDTSRYNNLNQIPNLGVGLNQTDDEVGTNYGGSWMLGDYTGKTDDKNTLTSYSYKSEFQQDVPQKVFKNVNHYIAAYGYPLLKDKKNGDGTYNIQNAVYTSADTTNGNSYTNKYAGTWYRELLGTNLTSSVQTYTIKSAVNNCFERSGYDRYVSTYAYLSLKAHQSNKTALRAKVNEAMSKMNDYGAYNDNGELKSLYYTTDSWNNFVTAYKKAQFGLTLLDGSCDSSALVTELTNAISGLTLAKGTAKQYNVYLDRTSAITDTTSFNLNTALTNVKTVAYTAKDNVKFTLESTPSGYNYKATVKINTDFTSPSSIVIGNPENIASSGFPTEYILNGTKLEATTAKGKTPVTYNDGELNFNSIAAGADSNIIIMNIYYNTRVEFAFNAGKDSNGNDVVNTGGSMLNQEFYYNISQNLTENAYKREYTVTYDANGGTLSGNSSDSCTYTFDGWATNLGGKLGDMASPSDILNAYSTSDSTVNNLTATWVDNQPDYKLASEPAYENHAFAGWYEGDSFVGGAEAAYTPTKTVIFTAKWVDISTVPVTVEDKTECDTEYSAENNFVPVIKGIDDSGNVIYSDNTVERYVESERAAYVDNYTDLYNALNKYNSANTSDNSKALLEAGQQDLSKPSAAGKIDNSYNDNFYVGDEQHSLSQMNLNHYTSSTLDDALAAKTKASVYNADSSSAGQLDLNNQVLAMAKAFANTAKTDTTAPEFKLSETATSINSLSQNYKDALSAAGVSTDSGAATYVFPGKGNYTYYCYTNSQNPTIIVSADDVDSAITTASVGDSGTIKTSYPTTATVTSTSAYKTVQVEAENAADYSKYTSAGVGSDNNYSQKDVVALTPTFTGTTGTALYTISAHDDAAAIESDCNMADTATLSSARSSAAQAATDNEITIYVDYKQTTAQAGSEYTMRVVGTQVNADSWLKQFHLIRTAGGSANWDWPQKNDGKEYDVVDPVYGQNNDLASCSFAYTFATGASTDISNNILNVDTSGYTSYDPDDYSAYLGRADLIKSVQDIISDNAADVTSNKITYGGLGYFSISGSGWSINYYPQSNAYTYVHIVDRWGNYFDDVIYVGNLDAIQAQIKSGNGTATVSESGGSGISTVSVSGDNISIVTDSESSLVNGVYNTTGNTVKLATGEPNTTYTLSIEDKATNSSSSKVTSDDNGYIDLAFEDDAYTDGVYTFTLNGVEINLYGEVEKSAVESVTYTPSTSEINTFTAKVNVSDVRVLKLRIIDSTGGTRTYDRNNPKVSVTAYNSNGDQVSELSRDIAYELWTLTNINLPHNAEYTAIAIYADWTKDAEEIGCKFTVSLKQDDSEIYSMSFANESGSAPYTSAEVVTGLDVTEIQFVLSDGTTQTYSANTFAEQNDGKLVFKAPKVWMTKAGENEITVKAKVAKEWRVAGTLTYIYE
ncbi:MAG: hypothetical protein PUB20_06200 [Clostridia bacterium]|nr:hypothetical protein [Clostridia bacterium]